MKTTVLFLFLSFSLCVSDVIDIYQKVTSSSVLDNEGIKFVPQWAIDRVNSLLWSTCFVSKKEKNPWWSLDMGRRETIFNVYIDFRSDDASHQSDVKREDIDDLTIYVDDDSNAASGSHTQQCENSQNPSSSKDQLGWKCSITGQYIHVIVKASADTYLALCEVLINYASSSSYYQFSNYEGEYFIVDPGEDPSKPSRNAIDFTTSTCSSTNSSSKFQSLTLRLPWPIYIQPMQFKLNLRDGDTVNAYVGSHLSNSGTDNPRLINDYKASNPSSPVSFERPPDEFVRDITVTVSSDSATQVQICEFYVKKASLLDIYGSSSAASFSELNTSTLASKAIDNSFQTAGDACYRSTQGSSTWWRLQSTEARQVGYIVIIPLPDDNALNEMSGFSVYVGNTTTNSGRNNVQCGSPWAKPSSGSVSVINVTCASRPVGEYVYIVSAATPTSSLSLCEVQFFDCLGSDPVVFQSSNNVTTTFSGGQLSLSCSASGCPTPNIIWTDPNGLTLSADTYTRSGPNVTSTINVQGSAGGGMYNCLAYNGRTKNASRQVTVSVSPMITAPPASVSVNHGDSAKLDCSAKGYPVPSITWSSPTMSSFTEKSPSTLSSVVTRSVDITNSKGADGGGMFTCTASNGKGNDAAANATVSVKPKITVLAPQSKTVIDGTAVKAVVCKTEGYPKPTVTWNFKSSVTSETTSQYDVSGSSYAAGKNLTLASVTLSDAGDYTCSASNTVGSDSSKFTLTVTVDVSISKDPLSVYGKVGDTLSLSCEATGNSAKVIEWYNDQTKVSAAVSSMTLSNGMKSTLRLSNVQLSYGSDKYKCKAGPSLGSQYAVSSASVTVGILGTITSFIPRYFNTNGSSNRPFSCNFTANPRPSSGELILDGKAVANLTQTIAASGYQWTVNFLIKSVTAQQGGDYMCVAKMNDSTTINATRQLGITADLTDSPQPLALEAGQNKNLTCSGAGFPLPTVSWEKTVGNQRTPVSGSEVTDYSNREITSTITFVSNDIKQVGSYVCTVENMVPKTTTKTSSMVDVSVKPVIAAKSSVRSATWGMSETLTCLAIGYPLPAISWSLKGGTVTGTTLVSAGGVNRTSTLTRTSVTALKDGGVYTCSATNSAGDGGSIDITLNFDSRVTTQPMPQEIAYGGGLTLTCEVTSYPAVSSPIPWKKDGQTLSLSTDQTNQDKTGVTSTLTISSVNENDGGNYICFGSSNPAAITIGNHFQSNPHSGNAIEGNATTLSCKVVGYPPRPIIWQKSIDGASSTYKDIVLSQKLTFQNHAATRSIWRNLTFSAIDRNDSGYYRCKVGSAQIVTSTPGKIDVYYLPSFSVDLPGGNHIVVEGKSQMFSCVAVGNPSPSIAFYKTSFDNPPVTAKVSADNDHNIGGTPGSGTATLTITNAQTSDSGQYFCKATNPAGSVESTISTITVQGPPSAIAPSAVSVLMRTDVTLTIMWSPPFDGGSQILNYTIRYKKNGSSDDFQKADDVNSDILMTTISGLKAFTDYAILVVAANVQGSANGSKPSVHRTNPGEPSPPLNFIAAVLNSTSMSATWVPPAKPNGIIQYYRVFYEAKGRPTRAVAPYKQFDGKSKTGIVSSLEKFTRYELYVKAYNMLGRSELMGTPSTRFTADTLQDAPTEPTDVTVDTVVNEESMLTVKWNEPTELNGIIQQYTVYWRQQESVVGVESNTTISGGQTQVTLDGLIADTIYVVQVKAHTILSGPRSNEKTGRTDEGRPSAPLDVAVVSSKATSVLLRWSRPQFPRGKITKFTVFYSGKKTYSEQGGDSNLINVTDSKEVDAQLTESEIEKLVPDTNWTFSVAASTSKGEGDRSVELKQRTQIDEPATIIIPPADTEKTTKTTTVITLTKPSEINGEIGRVDLLVASVASSTDFVDFGNYRDNEKYSPGLTFGKIYVAATFQSRDKIPSDFTLGDGIKSNGFVNGPLKAGVTYRYALRVYSAADTSLVTVSAPLTITTASESGSLGLIIGAAAGAIVLIIVIIIIIVVVLRKKREDKEESYSPTVQYFSSEEGGVEVLDSVKPSITVKQKNCSSVPGERAVLAIEALGKPAPLVTWRFNGAELPGSNSRVKILDSGSLQIDEVQESDAGLYKCSATSKVGSSYGQVTLRLDSVYANTSFRKEAIPQDRFESYVKELHANHNHGFSLEYPQLEGGEKHPFAVAKKEVNRGKNRYANIVPYDHCRVALTPIAGVPGSDYINASYLDAYQCRKGYIAAQGPNANTLNDFWRLLWQEKVPTVVMVTNLEEKGKNKCEKYWPDSGQKLFNNITVKLRQELTLSECTVRILDISQKNNDGTVTTHTTTQFHFTGWPDHGVPAYATTLLNFVKRARSHHEKVKSKGPMLVHCSAGVGRTGTFLVVDYSLQRLKKEKVIDICNLVNDFRDKRPTMVQAEAQYVFCHDAVLEYVLCGDTDLQAHNTRNYVRQLDKVDPATNKTGLQTQYDLLGKVSPPKSSFTFRGAEDPQCAVKNRYKEYLPPDLSRVYLRPKAGRPTNYAYINAYFVDGYQRRGLYIATQGPLESTVSDFWRMIWEQQCSVIVMLTGLQENGQEKSARYWPAKGKATYGNYSVALEDETMFGDYGVRKLRVTEGQAKPRLVIQYHYATWVDGQMPPNASSLIDMISQLEQGQQKAGNQQIAVVCNNGVGRSATFCALSNIVEQLKVEQIVDVFQAVKALRHHHPDSVSTLEHYKFCYKTALEFLDSFDTYANFKKL